VYDKEIPVLVMVSILSRVKISVMVMI